MEKNKIRLLETNPNFTPLKDLDLDNVSLKNLDKHKWITTYDIVEIFDAYAAIERPIFGLRYSVQNKKLKSLFFITI